MVAQATKNLLAMSMGFMMVFFGYNTAQNFVTPLFGNLGTKTLAILYGVFTGSLLAAPSLLPYIGGPRGAIMIGAFGYMAYMGSLIWIVSPIVEFAAGVNGFGAALIWTGQGIYLSRNSTPENRGFVSGVFWAILMVSNMLGNISASLILGGDCDGTTGPTPAPTPATTKQGWNGSDSYLFIALTGCASLGFISFILMGPSVFREEEAQGPKPSFIMNLSGTFATLFTPKMLLCLPIFLYSGISVSFYAAQFTRQFRCTSKVGWAMSGLGFTETVGALIFGRLSDRIGTLAILLTGGIIQTGAFFLVHHADKKQDYTLYLAGAALGLADCAFQTMMYKITNGFWNKQESDNAFACFKFLQSSAACAAFAYVPLFVNEGAKYSTPNQLLNEIFITGGLMWFSLVCFIICTIVFRKDTESIAAQNSVEESQKLLRPPDAASESPS